MIRVMLITAVTAALASTGHGDDPLPPERDPNLLKWVDPVLRWQPHQVTDANNAWTLWLRAAEKVVPPEEYGLPKHLHDVAVLNASAPRRQKLAAWVERNRPALKLIHAGLDRPHAALPPEQGLCDDQATSWELLGRMARLHRCWLVDAELAAIAGDNTRATAKLGQAMQFADRLNSTGWLALGVRSQKQSADVIARLHEQHLFGDNHVSRLIAALEDEPASGEAVARYLRYSFWRH